MKAQLNFIRGKVASFGLRRSRRILFSVLLLVFLLGAMGMLYMYMDTYFDIKDYERELAQIVRRSATLNKEVFKIVEYKEEWDNMQYKVVRAGQLKRQQMWLTPKLEALSRLMPDNVWLSSLSLQKPRTGFSLTLHGFALPGDNRGLRSIEDFAHDLKNNPIFGELIESINLVTAARTGAEGRQVMSFQLQCSLAAKESV